MNKSKKLRKERTHILAAVGHHFLSNYLPELRDATLWEMFKDLKKIERKIEKVEME